MNKFIAGLISLSLLATPVAAIAHDRDRRHEHREGNSVGLVIGLLLGGILLDRVVDRDRDQRREDRDDYRYERYDDQQATRCWQQRAYDYYGRPYLRTVCER